MRIAAQFTGTCSWFGGPEDSGVSPSEDLAWWETWDDVADDAAEDLFLEEQPEDTSGMARRLNPEQLYVACRWDYSQTSKSTLSSPLNFCVVYAPSSDRCAIARPADWGPHEEKTGGRAADLSPGLMEELELETDDTVVVIYLVVD
jgi:hypothetical protein